MKSCFVWEGIFSDLYASTISHCNFRQNVSEVLSQDFSEYCCFVDMRELEKNPAVIQSSMDSPVTLSVVVKAEVFNYLYPIPALLFEKIG